MSLAKVRNALVGRLRRVTSSSLFIPEIDGLRFVAIFLVVLNHLNGLIIEKSHLIFTHSPYFYNLIYNFFKNGSRGGIIIFYN